MSLPFLFFTFFLPTFSPFLIFLCKEDAANKFGLLLLARLGRRYDRLGYFNYSSRWKNVRLVKRKHEMDHKVFLGPGHVFGCPGFQLLFSVSASRGGLPLVGAPILMMIMILAMKAIIVMMVMMMVVKVVVCPTTDPPGPRFFFFHCSKLNFCTLI